MNLGGVPAVEVSAGHGHVCALLADHTVWCWGDNRDGALGIGHVYPNWEWSTVPVQVLFEPLDGSDGGASSPGG